MKIIKAQLSDVDKIAPLFDLYRQFYEQNSDLNSARSYLAKRLENADNVLFAAIDDNGQYIGFTQLYPTFCSVDMQRAWILYDLFVSEAFRRRRIAEKLLEAAQSFASDSGAVWLRLETAHTNIPGQKLYEKLGWKRDNDFHTYFYHLPSLEASHN